MDDIEEVCQRVIVINNGQIVHDSSLDEMRKKYLNKKIITIHTEGKNSAPKINGVIIRKREALEVQLEVDTKKVHITDVLKKVTSHYKISDIEIADPPIEEIVESIYARKTQ